jgi:hypothetical protein
MLEEDPSEAAVWAVGSLTPDDIERIHGQAG